MTMLAETGTVVAQSRGARVYAVIARKGGVGKTTFTVNLAAVAGQNNPARDPDSPAPVVAAGIDPQGSLEEWADRVPENGLSFDYVSTRGRAGELAKLKEDPAVSRIYVDSPGFMDTDADNDFAADPLGKGNAADALRDLLDIADVAIVPITTDFMSWSPAEFTIERVLKPRNIPFIVVINMWESRDGNADLKDAIAWVDERGYRRAPEAIRKLTLHSRAAKHGQVVTSYKESGAALRAREDFYKLSLAIEQVF
ncbi:ParA family protein [Kitasatospora sp. NBC_00315]|uniref:ParA family protein n=1 Tax=Kitasatospora sp. NBC_00315 TaxID=2975963 RepID=UPI0032516DD2